MRDMMFECGELKLMGSSRENIKITHPDDLALAAFFLAKQNKKYIQKQQLQETE